VGASFPRRGLGKEGGFGGLSGVVLVRRRAAKVFYDL